MLTSFLNVRDTYIGKMQKMATDFDPDNVTNTYPLYKFYDETLSYPLSNAFPYLVCLDIAYLTFVFKIGPSLMKNRQPFKLRKVMAVYNAIQVVVAFILSVVLLIPMIVGGIFPRVSAQFDPEIRKKMFFSCYCYTVVKLTELTDTIFFILRKKDNQVTFLHVYHHSSVVVGTWLMNFYSLNMTSVYGAFINSVVHVVMYFYYFMSALGPEYQKYLTWKRHITTFQLVQFASMTVHQIISLIYTKGEHTIIGIIYVFYSSSLFYKLFENFYKKSYKLQASNELTTKYKKNVKSN